MRVAVLEDEAPARRLVVRLLRELAPTWEPSAELDSVAAARAWFGHNAADLVLSDIRLSDGSALTLFEEGVVQAPVIFITAWDAYLVAAFAHLSVDYLLKPLEREALRRALEKFERLRRHFGKAQAQEAAGLMTRVPRQRVLVRYRAETRAMPLEEVAWFRADDRLTLAVDRSGREFVVDRTLSQLERELDPARFFRVNRAWLVQVSAVAGFRSAGRGRLALTLNPEPVREVVVSQEVASAFRAFIDR